MYSQIWFFIIHSMAMYNNDLDVDVPETSDFGLGDNDTDYQPSESDSGDEIEHSPKKRRAAKVPKPTSKAGSSTDLTDNPLFDDETLAFIRQIRFQSKSSEESPDDETLADIQRKQKQRTDEDEFTEKELT